ncbi:DUF2624 domain-containing protein [Lentibacillus amyloliquefaciens]|uniref:tRNA methyltransferase n=1 Tax=Lentibacillus amyloliquefaciens TaxID=1472767 RepID=A0A0U4F3F2_9BACI|nr:DUF2624 domain-containing protein [Lentibacillus amyloliquefaciens]ALX48102.1 hypothetical protein AOX59_05490 [Lentibacillus amyloliquefaciens]
MSTIIKQLINKKLKQLSPDELLRYAHQYGFSIDKNQAKEITAYLRQNPINPFEPEERMKMFKELARITDERTADKAQKLFVEIIKSYGMEGLFK